MMETTTGFIFGDRHWVSPHTARWCKIAGVRRITGHGLRGTHAQLTIEQGENIRAVQRALRHRSEHITRAHYINHGTENRLRIAKDSDVLGGIRGTKSSPKVPLKKKDSH